MANTCLVTKLQGTVSGDNLIKFGTLKLLVSRKYLTLSDNTVRLDVRYTGLTDGDTTTFKIGIPFTFNGVDYPANTTVNLRSTYGSDSNMIYIKISDIPADGTYAYISHKYNIHTFGGTGINSIDCIISPMELSYLSSVVSPNGVAIEGGSVAEMDCPNMERITFLKEVTGKLSDYPYPTKIKTINISQTNFAVVADDLMDFENLTTFICYANDNVELDTSDMISVFSTLTKLNTMDARNSSISCDANSFAEGLKTAGVVSRTIEITLMASQWGGSGTASTKKTFTFDAQGDYVIS